MDIFHTLLRLARSLSLQEILFLLFCTCFGVEWLTGKIRKLNLYNRSDLISNVLVGIISFGADLIFTAASLRVLDFLFHHARLLPVHDGLLSILLLFVLIDLAEYWFHRLSHEVNLLWTAHVVHHQSTFFNLSVGLRTSLFVPLFNVFFYFVFPVLGFDPADVLLIVFLQGMYQLLIHTKLIGKLGWLEYVFVTPSAHRVHHGSNAEYLDKNYGKVFILWDRLWKTYVPETVTVKYGLKVPQSPENPWQTVVNPMRTLLRFVRDTKDRKLRRALLFKKPDWAWEYMHEEKEKEYS